MKRKSFQKTTTKNASRSPHDSQIAQAQHDSINEPTDEEKLSHWKHLLILTLVIIVCYGNTIYTGWRCSNMIIGEIPLMIPVRIEVTALSPL
jgi:hypothetical protein